MSTVFDGLAELFVGALGDSEPFAYTTRAGASASILGIFETPSLAIDGAGDSAGDVRHLTTLAVMETDLPAGYGQGDSVEVKGRSYVVRAVLPDGHGMVELQLERLHR